MKRKTLLLFSLFSIIFFLGIAFRLSNISPNKIYPDAYQSLLVAQNIHDYHSVVGYLGPQGMLYPDFFAWSRPGFPLLMLLIARITHNLANAAQLISISASILSLPLAFFLGKKLYKSDVTGLTMMLLLAFSFNHTVWSGFILTEGFSVFLMILFLTFFFAPLKRLTKLKPILTGILVTLLIFTRYEYVLVLLPVLYYAKVSKNYTRTDLLLFFCSLLFTLCSLLFLLYPLPATLFLFFSQTQDLLSKSAIVLALLLLTVLIYRFLPQKLKHTLLLYGPSLFLWILWLGAFSLLIQLGFPSFLSGTRNITAGIRNFLYDDLILSCSFLIGVTIFIRRKIHTPLLLFSLFAVLILYSVYFRTNPAMERYLTHLIPFLLIPGSYGLAEVIKMGSISIRKHVIPDLIGDPVTIDSRFHGNDKGGVWSDKIILLFLFVTFFFQGLNTLNGIHDWGDRSWFTKSYDEHAAELTTKRIIDRSTILLVSFPEPYYYVSGLSTYSITDTYPYVYIPSQLNTRPLLISEDMGMHDIFPNFSKFLDLHMQDRRFDSFYVNLPYHYTDYSRRETTPVILYKTTVGELKKRIKESV